jgi:hypothetical protein
LGGAILGVFIGDAITTERWTRVAPLRPSAIHITPGAGRTTVAVSYAF